MYNIYMVGIWRIYEKFVHVFGGWIFLAGFWVWKNRWDLEQRNYWWDLGDTSLSAGLKGLGGWYWWGQEWGSIRGLWHTDWKSHKLPWIVYMYIYSPHHQDIVKLTELAEYYEEQYRLGLLWILFSIERDITIWDLLLWNIYLCMVPNS